MKDIISIINNLKSLDMNKIKSKGYCLVLCDKKIIIIRTPKKWMITIMFNSRIEYVYLFRFDIHDTILLNNGIIYMDIEEFISNIMETIEKN